MIVFYSFCSSEFEMIHVANIPSFSHSLSFGNVCNEMETIRKKVVFLLIIVSALKYIVVCVGLICALQSNHSGQSAGCLGNCGSGRRALPRGGS